MKRRMIYGVTTMSVAAAITLSTIAQDVPGRDTPTRDRPQQPQPGQRPGMGQQQGMDAQRVQFVRASRLIGTDVSSMQGQNLGEINNLAIDTQEGQVAYVIVSPGGELNLEGDQLLAIPFETFRITQGQEYGVERAVLTIDKNRLQQAPHIQKDNWNQLANQQFANQVYQFYGADPYWRDQAGTQPPGQRPGDTPPTRPGAGTTQPGAGSPTPPPGSGDPSRPGTPGTSPDNSGAQDPASPSRPGGMQQPPGQGAQTRQPGAQAGAYGQLKLVRASDVLGANIEDMRNQELGEVDDLVITTDRGRVAYAILTTGGVLGMGEDLRAVPWQALNVPQASLEQEPRMVLNIDKDRLEQAPSFSRQDWPNLADQQWARQVHAFYGTDVDWVYGIESSDERDNLRGWGPNDQYGRLFNPQSITTISGQVVSKQNFTPPGAQAQGVLLNIMEDGETIQVHLGPYSYMQRQSVQIEAGDQVEITGSRVMHQGQEVIMASQVRVNGQTIQLRDQTGRPMWQTDQQQPGMQPGGQRPGQQPGGQRPGQPSQPGRPGGTQPGTGGGSTPGTGTPDRP